MPLSSAKCRRYMSKSEMSPHAIPLNTASNFSTATCFPPPHFSTSNAHKSPTVSNPKASACVSRSCLNDLPAAKDRCSSSAPGHRSNFHNNSPTSTRPSSLTDTSSSSSADSSKHLTKASTSLSSSSSSVESIETPRPCFTTAENSSTDIFLGWPSSSANN